jgi:hypothetical protein
VVGGENDLVLDCYRLAHWYHVAPNHFLDMPLSEVRIHLIRTGELSRVMREAQENGREEDV